MYQGKLFLIIIMCFISFQYVYAQALNSTYNFKVNDDECFSGAEQSNPDAAPGRYGSMNLCVWNDTRNGGNDVYGTFWYYGGTIYRNNIRFTEHPSTQMIYPKAASNSLEKYLVTWQTNGQIFAQQLAGNYESEYAKVGEIVNVLSNNSLFLNNIYQHDLAMDDYSSIILFYSSAEYQNNIFVQNFDINEEFNNTNPVQINENAIHQRSYSPVRDVIAADFSGNFGAVWSQTKDSTDQVYFQLLRGSQKVGENILVSQDANSENYNPSVTADKDGNYFITWDKREENLISTPYGRIFNKKEGFITDEFRISQYGAFSDATAGSDGLGNFTLAWRDYENIYFQKFSLTGNPIDEQTRLNNSELPNVYGAQILTDMNFRKVLVWIDNRKGGADVYSKGFDYNGNASQTLQLNDDRNSAWQQNPIVISGDQGNYAVIWEDYRNGNSDIYLQMYDSLDNRIGDNVKVNTSTSHYIKDKSPVGIWNQNGLTVFWISDNKIMSQQYTPQASRIGENKTLVEENYITQILSVKRSLLGTYAVSWTKSEYGKFYYSYFSQALVKDGDIKVIENPDCNLMDISFSENFDIGVIWQQFPSSRDPNNIIIQKYTSAGNVFGDAYHVNLFDGNQYCGIKGTWINREFVFTWSTKNSEYTAMLHLGKYGQNEIQTIEKIASQDFDSFTPLTIYAKNNKFEILWSDGDELFLRKFKDNLEPMGLPVLVGENIKYSYSGKSINISDNKLISVFEDNQIEGRGIDIFGSVTHFDNQNYVENNNEKFSVCNYPNPFNNSTKIIFSLKEPAQIEVSVFNILGEKVSELFNGWKIEGEYEIDFTASQLTSGIYFCRVSSESETTVTKMVYLR